MLSQVHNSQEGITLIEMLVALTIIAVTGAAISGVLVQSDRNQTEQLVSDIKSLLRETRTKAIGSGLTQTVDFALGAGTISNASRTIQLSESVTAKVRSTLQTTSAIGTSSILIFADGSSTGGEIILEFENETKTVQMHWLSGPK